MDAVEQGLRNAIEATAQVVRHGDQLSMYQADIALKELRKIEKHYANQLRGEDVSGAVSDEEINDKSWEVAGKQSKPFVIDSLVTVADEVGQWVRNRLSSRYTAPTQVSNEEIEDKAEEMFAFQMADRESYFFGFKDCYQWMRDRLASPLPVVSDDLLAWCERELECDNTDADMSEHTYARKQVFHELRERLTSKS